MIRMISLEKLRELEPELAKVSDEELVKIRNLLYSLAELALESYVESKRGSKNILGVSGLGDTSMEELSKCKMENQKKE